MKTQRLFITLMLIVSLAIMGIACSQKSLRIAKDYDRQGLVDLMQRYIGALAKHTPGDLPFADKVKFTENTDKGIEFLAVGKGLWETATEGPKGFEIYAADPVAQAAATLVVMKENNKDIIFGARIKLVDGKIAEAEHLVVRGGSMSKQPFSSMPTMQKARPGFAEDIPAAEQMTREDLLKIGFSYYDALTSEDGTRAPFAKECERHENGMTTAGGKPPKPEDLPPGAAMPTGGFGNIPRDCEGQLSAGVFSYITEIRPHMVVADVQKGISVGFSMFRHDGTKRLPKDAKPGTDNKTTYGQFNLAAMHIYKIRNGKLYEIEAPGAMLPYGVKSGYEAEEKIYPVAK